MTRFSRRPFIALLATGALLGFCIALSVCEAKKPGGSGGGGKGGGADYRVLPLAPPGADLVASYATDLNEQGDVVGRYEDQSGGLHAFHYNAAGNSYLEFGPGIRVFGLNNLGQMTGVDEDTGEGLYWRSPGDQNPLTLAPLPGYDGGVGHEINDSSVIVGASYGDGFPAATAWKVDSQGTVSEPILLPFPAGDIRGAVTAINELDDGLCCVVGYSGAVNLYETAVQWTVAVVDRGLALAAGPLDVGSLAGGPSAAFGVNAAGDIVGRSGVWPFVKTSGGAVQPLPGIPKATWGYAEGINDDGVMVGVMGYLAQGRSVEKAVIWPNAGAVVDLNKKAALGRSNVLEAAFQISNSGAILAYGFLPDVSETGSVACLLVPNP